MTFPGHGARQGRDKALNPWTVVPELLAVVDWARVRWDSISLQANSIGAYFAMLALDAPDKALLLSPILDMERLILDMMGWAKVTERELSEKGEIATSFGQTLSWAYLCYVREYPVHNCQCPICILYAGQDNMTSRQTVEEFTLQHGAQLTIMDNGEHWFHTLEQREVLQSTLGRSRFESSLFAPTTKGQRGLRFNSFLVQALKLCHSTPMRMP